MPVPPSRVISQKPTTRAQTQISKSSVLDRIKPIGFDETEGIKALIYGQSGSGKTTLWATFPGPILAILASGGFRPGELRSVDTEENKSRISSFVLESVADAHDVIHHVKTSGTYQTVVLDHVTGLQDLTLKEILGLDELPAQKSWGMATQQHYGTSTQQCKEIIRALLNLTINVVIIGQERVFGGKEDGGDSEIIKPTVAVSATKSLAEWINPACDYVIQMFKRPKMKSVPRTIGKTTVTMMERDKGVEYCARTEVHDVFMTKFRVPKGHPLPSVIVDPNYDKLMGVIRGEEVEGAEYPQPT